MKLRSFLPIASAALFLAPTATAQSTIYGLDVRLQQFFDTTTTDFVGNFNVIGGNADPVFALDFDETATTLWGIQNTTLQYGTFDLVTGLFSGINTVSGLTFGSGATGLTCTPNGTWYASQFISGVGSQLYVGDVTTGTFTLVGPMSAVPTDIFIDISANSVGQVFAHSISSDSLYSVNTTTGAATLLGPTGIAANFAQGMDFDWSTDTLYAFIYTGGGVSNFCSLDTTTGVATVVQNTTALNAECEIAIRVAGGGAAGTAYCAGDGTGLVPCPCGNTGTAGRGCANSTPSGGALLSATGSASISAANLVLQGSGLQPGQPGLYFQGNNAINGGNGIQNGDGLRCAGGNVRRLQVRTAGGATSPNPGASETTVNIAVAGAVLAGDTKRYQLWYRNPAPGAPCGTGFNYSNGLEVVWAP